MLIGYVLTSAGDAEGAAEHRRALAEAGCTLVVEDDSTGGRWEQPELRRMLGRLQEGDMLVVFQMGCLGRSLPDAVRCMGRILAIGAGLRSLGDEVDTAAPDGPAVARVLRSLAALDRDTARARVNAGLAAARAQGRRGGRRPKLSPQQEAAIAADALSGRRTGVQLARLHKVSAPTISRILAAHRAGVEMRSGADGDSGGGAGEGGGGEPADTRGKTSVVGVLPSSALDGRIAIVGTSGSGKTYAAKGLVERLMAGGGRVCVVDPLGVWWGLQAAPDGAPSGFPVVVFGGAHADVPLDHTMGAALGHLVGTHALACVVDVSDLGSSVVRRAFVAAFAEALYEANMEPLHLVLDEADLWAPQRTQAGCHELLGRVEEIVRRGRIRGFVPWLITQRPAVLHKDVLSQADILVSMKLTASQDRDAVGRWIEGQADRREGQRILAALPRLHQGEGYLWAPAHRVLARVQFPRIATLDSSGTPRRAEKAGTSRTLAAVDLEGITAALRAGATLSRRPGPQ